jgi:Cu+-exporting ATPase
VEVNMAVDPVCGMEVDADDETSASYGEKTYHFCAEGCRRKFVSEPGKYVPEKKTYFSKRVTRSR